MNSKRVPCNYALTDVQDSSMNVGETILAAASCTLRLYELHAIQTYNLEYNWDLP